MYYIEGTDMGQYKLLSPQEERQAINDAQKGDEGALERLVTYNQGLVWRVVRQYNSVHLHPDDLFQEGVIGLINAVRQFDLSKDSRLSTFATYWIRQTIQRAIETYEYEIRLPSLVFHQYRKYNELAAIKKKQVRPLEEIDLAHQLGISLKTLRALSEYHLPISVDEPLLDGDGVQQRRGELIEDEDAPNPCQLAMLGIQREQLERAFTELSELQRMVIQLRFGFGDGVTRSLREVGRLLGITQEGVRQSQFGALKKLRRALAYTADDP